MSWPRNPKIKEIYKMYLSGYSLAQVAKAYGYTRQSVWELFSYNNLPRRPKKLLPFITFNNSRYTRKPSGYYSKTNGERTLLHRDVWEFHFGKIPKGWDIHHKNGKRDDNDINNLECLEKAEHTRLYSPHNNQYTRGRKCHGS